MISDYERLSLHTLWTIANCQMRALNQFHETFLKSAIEQHHQHLQKLKEELDSLVQKSINSEVDVLKREGFAVTTKLALLRKKIEQIEKAHT